MYKVVQQISILGGKIFRSGLGIVGAENRRDLGMVGKGLGNALYGIRRETQEDMVRRGYRMRVYVPYGKEWFPYFYRRLRERKENVTFVLRSVVRR